MTDFLPDSTRHSFYLLFDTGRHARMGTMLAKDSVRNRLQSDSGLSFTEFSYQLLQGYDFVHLCKAHGVTVQVRACGAG